jgi:hypothetical protein
MPRTFLLESLGRSTSNALVGPGIEVSIELAPEEGFNSELVRDPALDLIGVTLPALLLLVVSRSPSMTIMSGRD